MNIILFDNECRGQLFPLSETRPVSEIRVGITTIKEKWERSLPGIYSYLSAPYLATLYPLHAEDNNLFIEGNIIPTVALCRALQQLSTGQILSYNGRKIAFFGSLKAFKAGDYTSEINFVKELRIIEFNYHIFLYNGELIVSDFFEITQGRISEPLPPSNRIIGNTTDDRGRPLLFLEEGVSIECCILNLTEGPIYIGKQVTIMEGSMIRGPFAACQGSVVRLGTMIYQHTTIGPYCKVGGELSNVVMMSYSNKQHDGFLGSTVIGNWCNIAAVSGSTNLRVSYAKTKSWNNATKRFEPTGLQFFGFIMGDYSSIGTGVILNPASMIGVACNIYGIGTPRAFIPSFSIGGYNGFKVISFDSFISTIQAVMARRNRSLSDEERLICAHLFEQTYNKTNP